jgi:2TM domain
MQDDTDRIRLIRRRVRREAGFYRHLLTYLVVITGLFLLNLASNSYRPGETRLHHWWVIWVALGWGIGIAAHGARTMLRVGPFSSAWEDRKVNELLARETNKAG